MSETTKTRAAKETRRGFLQQGWTWLRLAVLGALLYPLLRFLGFQAPRKPRLVKVYKDLTKGGHVVERDFILFANDEKAWAVSRKCTHLGCRLNYRAKEDLLLCPCHQSRFSVTGKVINGPAKKALPLFAVARMPAREGKGYIVTL